jgi:hypothetical protein
MYLLYTNRMTSGDASRCGRMFSLLVGVSFYKEDTGKNYTFHPL